MCLNPRSLYMRKDSRAALAVCLRGGQVLGRGPSLAALQLQGRALSPMYHVCLEAPWLVLSPPASQQRDQGLKAAWG